jgi:hypothetical protein
VTGHGVNACSQGVLQPLESGGRIVREVKQVEVLAVDHTVAY